MSRWRKTGKGKGGRAQEKIRKKIESPPVRRGIHVPAAERQWLEDPAGMTTGYVIWQITRIWLINEKTCIVRRAHRCAAVHSQADARPVARPGFFYLLLPFKVSWLRAKSENLGQRNFGRSRFRLFPLFFFFHFFSPSSVFIFIAPSGGNKWTILYA